MTPKKKNLSVETEAECYLCGTDGKPMEMAVMASPVISHRVDLALIGTWLCASPCFEKARNSELISKRIYQQHDDWQSGYNAHLQTALIQTIAERPDQDHLPEGLRCTEDDVERLAACEGNFSVENLQDEETLNAAFKMLRTHLQLPYYHCQNGVGEFWDFAELKTRLTNLAKSKR